eukprot:TRINITY_DN645_c0_g1_i1.p1 TRINITY_DN645_c0_g1~~TRINITY_DN645_c0_g1_i1.p1  ORF type:complete len:254 (+),score=59.47 TRINITY_DN645_c0_g1_i1:75-764(+)
MSSLSGCTGAAVHAQWPGCGWYPGRITCDNGDGTYAILFDGDWSDGNYLSHVPACEIRFPAQWQHEPYSESSWGSRSSPPVPELDSLTPQSVSPRSGPPTPPRTRLSPPAGSDSGRSSARRSPCPTERSEAPTEKTTVISKDDFAVSFEVTIERLRALLADVAADSCTFRESTAADGRQRYAVCLPRGIPTDIRKLFELCWNRNYRVEGPRWVWEHKEPDCGRFAAGAH